MAPARSDFMLEFTKDDHIKRLDKKIDSLEKRLDKSLRHLDNSFRMFIDILEKMENENKRLLKERDNIIADYNRLLKKIEPKPQKPIEIIEPVKKQIKSDFDLVRLVAKQTITETPSDQLYELVLLSGKISTVEAARRLNMRESRIRRLAGHLENKKLIDIRADGDKFNLVKI